MDLLTEHQSDALAEMINIAFGRTASSLSELTNRRILLKPPQVAVHAMEEMYPALAELVGENIATMHQIFTGPLSGDAFLVLDYQGAVELVSLLTDIPTPADRLDASAREVLTEVGNILLNACLGMFGNLLQVHISFSVPRLRLEDLGALAESLVVGREELRYALVISMNFQLQDSEISGYLVIVMGVTSLQSLIRAVETWETSLLEQQ